MKIGFDQIKKDGANIDWKQIMRSIHGEWKAYLENDSILQIFSTPVFSVGETAFAGEAVATATVTTNNNRKVQKTLFGGPLVVGDDVVNSL